MSLRSNRGGRASGAGLRAGIVGLAALLVLAVCSTGVFALAEFTLFGPKRYDRLKGKPTVYKATFGGCGNVASAVLRVTNGDSEDTRITSAEIEVNGREVAEERDFKKTAASFERTFPLRESNTLTVTLKSGRHDDDAAGHHDDGKNGRHDDSGDRDDDHAGDRRDDRDGRGNDRRDGGHDDRADGRDDHKGGSDKDTTGRTSSKKRGDKDDSRNKHHQVGNKDDNDEDHDRHAASFLIIQVVAQGCGGPSDSTPPVISNPQPPDGSLLNMASPAVSAQYTDDQNGTGIDISSVGLSVDGMDVTSASSVSLTGISYIPASNLPDGEHRVVVTVADKAGNPATLAWTFTTDTKAPVVTVTSHQNAQFLNTLVVTLSGSLDDPLARVTVNGQNAQVTGNTFSLANFALTEGDNPITATATDLVGNSSATNINIILDTVFPVIQTIYPQPNDFVNTPSITVAGTLTELHLAGLRINEIPVQVTNGSFSPAIALQTEGGSVITLRAKDLADNETVVTIPVTLDTAPPVVQISSPVNNAFMNTPQVAVAGTVSEEVTSVTVNAVPAAITGNSFSLANFTLTEGSNPLSIEARDRAGNIGTQPVTVILDTIKPVIQVAFPTMDAYVSTMSITVSGSVSDVNTAGLWINNTPVQLENGNFALAGVSLSEGSNTISVRASDKAGNESVLPVSLTRDTIAPVMTITAPAQNAMLNSKLLTVTGTVSELNAMVTVNGTPAQVSGQDFTLAGVVLEEGQNEITITATDRAGNPGPAVVTVNVDTISPSPPVLGQPVSPIKTAQTSISGTAETGSTVEVSATGPDGLSSVIGTLPVDAQGGFTIPVITLVEGTTSFTARSKDATGNWSAPSVPISVTMDTIPPVITVTGPANNSYTSMSTVQVTGSLNDATANLSINGTTVSLNSTSFDHTATLSSGLNSLVLVATDLAGNPSNTTVLVTLDQTPPSVTISSPLNNSLVTTLQVLVSGIVDEPVTSVTVNGLTALVSGQSFSIAAFTLSENLNEITVEAKDRAGNPGSSIVKVTLDSTPPVVSLSAPAQAAAGTTISLSFAAGDTGGLTLAEVSAGGASLWSFSPNAEPATQNSISYTLSPDLAPGLVVDIQGRAYDAAGNMGSAVAHITITSGPSGPGYIQGEVYDDSAGLRLAGASISVLSSGGTGTSQVTQADGSYFFEMPAGDYSVSVVKAGFTSMDRLIMVRPEKKTVTLDSRLTPVGGAKQEIGPAGGRVTALLSAPTSTTGASIAFELPAGALAVPTDLRLTPISNQGLVASLPAGWSPLGVIDIRSFAADGSEIAGVTSFAASGTIILPMPASLGLAPAAPVALTQYDAPSRQWTAQTSGVVNSDGSSVAALISSTGQYAFVLPDDGSCAPVPGSAIPQCGPSPASVIAALSSQPSATGRVVPAVAPAAKGLKALGELVLAAPDGSGAVLASGTVVNAAVTERFDLLSGSAELPSSYIQDLVLYRMPCITNRAAGSQAQGAGFSLDAELSAPGSGKIGASFPVTPSREFTIVDLLMGKVGIAITLPEAEASGTLLGASGGRTLDSDGTVLAVPAGALARTVPVQTRTIAPAIASALVGPDFTLLRSVEVSLTGAVLSTTAELSIPVPAGFNTGLPVVVARAIDVAGVQRLKLVALARLSGSLITSLVPGPSLPVPGITSSGQYFFLQAKAPLGFVAGTVRNAASAPAQSALVASSTCSLADLTAADGKYLIASTVSDFIATATDMAKKDTGTAGGTIAAAGQVAALDLQIQVVRPWVLSALPSLLDRQGMAEPGTAIVIAFSEPVNKATVTSASVVVTGPTGSTLQGTFSMNPEGTVATFYPASLLASQVAYTITISQAIQDLQGYTMAAAYQSGFTVRDTTPPPMPQPGSITATFPNADGIVTVTGTHDSAEFNSTVLIINDTTGEIVSVMPLENGSFSGMIHAQLGDEIKVVLMDPAGNQTLISYITFKSADGKYLVTAKGGIVEGEGGLKLEIPEGALYGPTVVKITPLLENQLPQDNPLPSVAKFLAGVNIEAGGLGFRKEVKLSVPAPSDMPTDASPFFSRPAVHKNPDGTEEQVYVIEDSAKVIDGRITTASPPFEGIMGPGLFVFQFTPAPLDGPVIIDGYAYRNMDGIGGYQPGSAPTADKPIKGALIRGAAAYNYVSYSKDDGHYAAFGFSTIDVCRSFYTTAMHPQTMYKHTAKIVTCNAPYIVNNFNFMLADKDSQDADTTAPSIIMNLQIVHGQGDSARFVSGTVPVGTDIEIPISILDQSMAPVPNTSNGTATLTVSYKTPGMQNAVVHSVTLAPTGETIHTYLSAENPAPVYNYAYLPGFSTLIVGSASSYFRPDKAGTYVFVLEAVDSAGNKASRTITIRAVDPGTQPDGVDGPPQADEILPSDGAQEIMVNMPVTAMFNEPVKNVTSGTFRLMDLGPVDLVTGQTPTSFTPVTVPSMVTTSLENGHVQATLAPAGNLQFSRRYEIVLSQGITDLLDNPSVCPAGSTPPAEGCLLPLNREYRSVFTTKRPQIYDLESGQFTGGRGIDLYTDIAGNTYAYVTAGDKGWRTVDVTDPTRPEVKKSYGTAGFSYRGVDVAADGEDPVLAITEDIRYNEGSQYGYVRFYSLTTGGTSTLPPAAAPKLVGREKLSEQYTGIPGRVSMLNDFAYIAMIGTGLQVVDIKASKAFLQTGKQADGSTIVGGFETVTQGYKQPTDIVAYKNGRAALSTTSGHLLLLDVNIPQIPQLMTAFKPTPDANNHNYDSAWRVAVAADYAYSDSSQTQGAGGLEDTTEVIDLAVTSSMAGRIHTVDITDPYNPKVLGVTRDASGGEVIAPSSDITVSRTSGLVYVASGMNLYVIDVKDPYDPRLLNIVDQTLAAPGSPDLAVLGASLALVEKEGWVYLASQQQGMRVLDLDPITIEFWSENLSKIENGDEFKYSDGTKPEKKYQIIFKPNGQTEVENEDCQKYNNYQSTLSVIDSHGTVTTAKVNGADVKQEYKLAFAPDTTTKACNVFIKVPGQNAYWPYFILSNRDDLVVPAQTVKVTPGLSGRRVQVRIPSIDGKNNVQTRPVEPVGVIVLAIDGLRQDVLYPKPTSSEPGVKASYYDPNGCRQNGQNTSCYVAPTQLKGFCEVLGGKIVGDMCDTANFSTKHVKLPDVTTIFPSITFAAWASIYSGKPPKETGILGNEFFARDLITMGTGTTAAWNTTVPGLNGYPPGLVTLDADGGAFRPAPDTTGVMNALLSFKPSAAFALNHVMPAEFLEYKTMAAKLNNSAPGTVLKSEGAPLWKEINEMVKTRYPSADSTGCAPDDPECRCDKKNFECRTVSIFNQYVGRSTDESVDWWGTPSLRWKYLWEMPTLFDTASASEAVDFINNYFEKNNPNGKRKRFPALFSVYLPGLDHDAHVNGMGSYMYYFKDTVDVKVKEIVQALKDNDEFENKIFIIVSDHGETQMPEKILNPDTEELVNVYGNCELDVDMKDRTKQRQEKNLNNSLHIWELAELFSQVGYVRGNEGLGFAVMAPAEIAIKYKQYPYGAKPDTTTANIIAALNGPMAHIYVKNRPNNTWTAPRFVEDVGYAAELLRLSLSSNKSTSNLNSLFSEGIFEKAIPIIAGLKKLMTSVDVILIRRGMSYEVFQGIKQDGTDIISEPLVNNAMMLSEKYVRAVKRIEDMNHIQRSGDLVLIMKDDTSGSESDRFVSGYACKSWHGSLNQGDSFVPMILTYPSGNRFAMDTVIQQISSCPSGQCSDNWKMPDIIRSIINKQYGGGQ